MPCPEPDVEGLFFLEQTHPRRGGEQPEGDSHHVGMQIAEEEAEEGELRYRLRHARRDDAGGAPPPPELCGVPLVGGRAGNAEVLYVNPSPESTRSEAVRRQELQEPLQVPHHRQQERGRQAEDEGPDEDAAELPLRRSAFRAAMKGGQVVDEAEDGDHRQGGDHRQAEVIADRRAHAGQLAGHRHQQVAAVVVADGMAGEPGVVRREVLAVRGGVQKGEVHRLLRPRDVRDVGAQEGGEHEGEEEDPLDDEQEMPILAHEAAHLVSSPPDDVAGARANEDDRPDDAAGGIRQHAGGAQDPEHEADDEEAERLGEGVAAVREAREEEVGQREDDERHDLERQPPGQRFNHVRSLSGGAASLPRARERLPAVCLVLEGISD